MQERFLLDTNAYFNFLKNTVFLDTDAKNNSYEAEIRRIKEGKCYISEISRLEIISVIGKPFSPATLNTAQTIVQFALIHNFGSLDAVIAATLLDIRMQEEFGNMCMITSDKGLKACLNKCKLPYWDAFKKE